LRDKLRFFGDFLVAAAGHGIVFYGLEISNVIE
jgi:hypothetical protein